MDQLLERVRAGDRQAEEQLFKEVIVRFRRFAARKVEGDMAEDIAQEACITVFTKLPSQELEGEFFAWAHGVLKMTLLRYRHADYKRKEREIPMPERFELPERSQHQPMLRQHLLACLKKLVKEHTNYARIYNHHQQGYPADEICQKLSLKRDQYYVYLGRSRSLLKECLSSKGISV